MHVIGVSSHLSLELQNSLIMVQELKKFVRKQGSEVDELQSISTLKSRFDALERSVVNSSALVKAFDLIKLFRAYHLSLNWDTVTNEYTPEKDKLENCMISELQFNQIKTAFNAKYPMPHETPLLSDIIDLCQERPFWSNYQDDRKTRGISRRLCRIFSKISYYK